LKNHPYFVACQFHPELKSRPDDPHPLFVGLVKAMMDSQKEPQLITHEPSAVSSKASANAPAK